MIVAKAQRLQERIAEMNSARLSDHAAASLAERRVRLDAQRDAIASARAFLDSAANAGIDLAGVDTSSENSTLDAARASVSRLRATAADPAAFLEGDLFAQCVRNLERVTDVLERQVADVWQRHTQVDEWSGRLEIARVLGRAVRQGTTKHQLLGHLQNVCAEAVALAQKQPVASDLVKFEALQERYESLWPQVLGGEDLDSAVLEFIRSAAHDGASLAELTERVVTGLEQLGLTTNFRIVLSR